MDVIASIVLTALFGGALAAIFTLTALRAPRPH